MFKHSKPCPGLPKPTASCRFLRLAVCILPSRGGLGGVSVSFTSFLCAREKEIPSALSGRPQWRTAILKSPQGSSPSSRVQRVGSESQWSPASQYKRYPREHPSSSFAPRLHRGSYLAPCPSQSKPSAYRHSRLPER